MFDQQQKSTGRDFTWTVALLSVAFIFSPAVLIVSRPVGAIGVWLALACSGLCIAIVWVNWRRYSRLSIPSIEAQETAHDAYKRQIQH